MNEHSCTLEGLALHWCAHFLFRLFHIYHFSKLEMYLELAGENRELMTVVESCELEDRRE